MEAAVLAATDSGILAGERAAQLATQVGVRFQRVPLTSDRVVGGALGWVDGWCVSVCVCVCVMCVRARYWCSCACVGLCQRTYVARYLFLGIPFS